MWRTMVSPVRFVRLTAQFRSLQRFYTQKLHETKILLGDMCTVLEDNFICSCPLRVADPERIPNGVMCLSDGPKEIL